MDIDQRIAQWEKMTREAPDGMAWFSLGNAYREAERLEDAAGALRRAIELDPGLSRAYQLLGQVLLKLDQPQQAAEVLTRGYTIAAERGDVMPQRAMGSLLEQKLHQPLPQVKASQAQPQATGEQILDRRTGKPGTRMTEPPMRGPLGRFIQAHFSQETWREWIHMGTKVINEMRLDFSRQEHQQAYDQHMMQWLGISQEEVDAFDRQQSGS